MGEEFENAFVAIWNHAEPSPDDLERTRKLWNAALDAAKSALWKEESGDVILPEDAERALDALKVKP